MSLTFLAVSKYVSDIQNNDRPLVTEKNIRYNTHEHTLA
jgi:hypothetical protein